MQISILGSKVFSFFEYILKRAVALAALLIFIRILLKFFGANAASFFVDKLYTYTDILLWPFQGIFANIEWRGHIIDIVSTCAIAGYAILVFIILQIMRAFTRQ